MAQSEKAVKFRTFRWKTRAIALLVVGLISTFLGVRFLFQSRLHGELVMVQIAAWQYHSWYQQPSSEMVDLVKYLKPKYAVDGKSWLNDGWRIQTMPSSPRHVVVTVTVPFPTWPISESQAFPELPNGYFSPSFLNPPPGMVEPNNEVELLHRR